MIDLTKNIPYENKNNVNGFHAGDSVDWFVSFMQFKPSAGYNLQVILINATQNYKISALSDTVSDTFKINLTNLVTEAYVAGRYQVFFVLSRNSDNFTAQLANGFLDIAENILTVANLDYKTPNQKILDQINALLENRFTSDHVSYKIGDREIVKMTPQELFTQKMLFENLVRQELISKEVKEKGYTKKNQLVIKYAAPWQIY